MPFWLRKIVQIKNEDKNGVEKKRKTKLKYHIRMNVSECAVNLLFPIISIEFESNSHSFLIAKSAILRMK